ncbi:MAG: hypothetical protein P4L83_20450 [Nevskia sp.]|nr:hypothetical protein [Nevskia sp.]
MFPLPIVSLIVGLFVVCAVTLAGLLFADWLAERRLNPPKKHKPLRLQLNLDSLIRELTATA